MVNDGGQITNIAMRRTSSSAQNRSKGGPDIDQENNVRLVNAAGINSHGHPSNAHGSIGSSYAIGKSSCSIIFMFSTWSAY